jgi:hypothetical protein
MDQHFAAQVIDVHAEAHLQQQKRHRRPRLRHARDGKSRASCGAHPLEYQMCCTI